jgi:hypothetical protein
MGIGVTSSDRMPLLSAAGETQANGAAMAQVPWPE